MNRRGQRGARGENKNRPPSANAAHAHWTRRALLDAGREVFTEQGYAHTTIPAIFRRAGMTREAFYHHFPTKTVFFTAVFTEVCQETTHAVQACMQRAEGDTWERFMASLGVLLDQLGRPSVQRIVCVDGPAVLGWASVYHRAPDKQFLRSVFEQLQAEGVLLSLPLEPCVHLVWALCSEAAAYIAQAEEHSAQRERAAVLRRLLDGIRM